jgi:hypothetical protein
MMMRSGRKVLAGKLQNVNFPESSLLPSIENESAFQGCQMVYFPGLPDGIFSYQKIPICICTYFGRHYLDWKFLVHVYYAHFLCLMNIRYFFGHLVYFGIFGGKTEIISPSRRLQLVLWVLKHCSKCFISTNPHSA